MRFSKKEHAEEDFELNIASIIDCFTVLITYLLVSASFISLGVIDVSDLTQRAENDKTPEAQVSLAIQLTNQHDVTFQVNGTPQVVAPVQVAAKDGQVDRDTMVEKLTELKTKWPDLNAAVLSASGDIEYDELVQVIDSSKKVVPNMTLGERIN
jgi:biopolymer transport protein ExbD